MNNCAFCSVTAVYIHVCWVNCEFVSLFKICLNFSLTVCSKGIRKRPPSLVQVSQWLVLGIEVGDRSFDLLIDLSLLTTEAPLLLCIHVFFSTQFVLCSRFDPISFVVYSKAIRKRRPSLMQVSQWVVGHGRMFYCPGVQGYMRNMAATSPSSPV